ncbi:MAG TPA: VCBS repeat-containing protein, partial [Candidatus Krumholzibacterium sp.]|nr:VCBS repeat-containing protein [Candidatus Krumholzibacterium sp.]
GHGAGLGDLDGDGDIDAVIVCASYGDRSGEYDAPTRVYLNDGRGVFTDSGQDFGDTELSGTGVTLADVDMDGDLDALVNYYGADNVVWLNDGHGSFSRGEGTFPGSSTFGDLDGDGIVDLFSKEHEKGYFVMTGNGDGTFSERWRIDDAGAVVWGDVLLVDIDSDGDLDAFATNGHFMRSAWPSSLWLNDGTGLMSRAGGELPALMNSALAAADLDGDGSLEIICSDHYNPVRIYSIRIREDGSGDRDIELLDTGVSMSCMEMYRDIDARDLDGDGDVDLFLSNFNRAGRGGPNEVWINDSPRR